MSFVCWRFLLDDVCWFSWWWCVRGLRGDIVFVDECWIGKKTRSIWLAKTGSSQPSRTLKSLPITVSGCHTFSRCNDISPFIFIPLSLDPTFLKAVGNANSITETSPVPFNDLRRRTWTQKFPARPAAAPPQPPGTMLRGFAFPPPRPSSWALFQPQPFSLKMFKIGMVGSSQDMTASDEPLRLRIFCQSIQKWVADVDLQIYPSSWSKRIKKHLQKKSCESPHVWSILLQNSKTSTAFHWAKFFNSSFFTSGTSAGTSGSILWSITVSKRVHGFNISYMKNHLGQSPAPVVLNL